MKKITQLLLICALFFSSTSIFAQNTPVRTSPVSNTEAPIFTESTRMVACEGLLANYTNPTVVTGIASQEFGAGNPTFSNMSADDFVVPAGTGAIICQIAITADGGNFVGDPTSEIDMNIYADAGGLPGALIFSESFDPAVVDADNDGSFLLDPTAVPTLTAGATYWMSIVADMDFGTGGQWFWGSSADVNGNPAVFQNPGDGFATGCTTWANAETCLGNANAVSLAMDISFNAVDGPPTAVCQDITVQLDASGNATILPSDVDGGSSDAEGAVTLSLDNNTFGCADVGVTTTVTLTVTDSIGQTASCTATVTVEDNVNPTILVNSPYILELDATGNAILTVADLDNGTTDACGIASITLSLAAQLITGAWLS